MLLAFVNFSTIQENTPSCRELGAPSKYKITISIKVLAIIFTCEWADEMAVVKY